MHEKNPFASELTEVKQQPLIQPPRNNISNVGHASPWCASSPFFGQFFLCELPCLLTSEICRKNFVESPIMATLLPVSKHLSPLELVYTHRRCGSYWEGIRVRRLGSDWGRIIIYGSTHVHGKRRCDDGRGSHGRVGRKCDGHLCTSRVS